MVKFHAELIPDIEKIEPTSYMDAKIGRFIYENNGNEDYSTVLAQNEEWDVFFQLCDLRRGILNWYDFKEGAKVLEIEGQFGPVTGMLSDKAEHVVVTESNPYRAQCITQRYRNRSNIDVYAGHIFDIAKIRELDKFDYIILLGALERIGNGDPNQQVYADYLLRLQDYLKEDGKIILSVDNRFGLRNFCGERDSVTGRPFDGINHYPFGSSAYTFSKKELENIVSLAGLESYKFFYPLPDYLVPQLVYSEDYFGGSELYERLSTYSRLGDTLVAWERNLYKDIIENNVQEFFANSFLIECSRQQEKSDVSYAVLSIDRGVEGSCTTAVRKMQTVEKRYAFPEGKERLERANRALDELQERGIPVIPHEFDGKVIRMPYEKAETLSNYLKRIVAAEPEKFVLMFDRLYQYILQSSEHVSEEENYFRKQNPGQDYGVILGNAYLDMVPANCFFDGVNMIFFDQEFIRENFPAKYVLYRAIKYTYMYIAGVEAIVPMNVLKEKFALSFVWDIFEQEENTFIADNRKTDSYKTYYRGVYLNFPAIYCNAEKLTYKGESVTQFQTDRLLQQVQQVRLEMLGRIHDVCQKYGLHYFMIYGTLLGAVRHKNFVPWDDDADIAMLREDYEKFIQIAPEELKDFYTLQTMYNDAECFYGGYAKLRKNHTTALEQKNWGKNCHQGIWVDIIPIDRAYSDDKKNLEIKKQVFYYQNLLYMKVYDKLPGDYERNAMRRKKYRRLARRYSHTELCQKLDEVLQSCKIDTGVKAIFAQIMGPTHYKCFDQQDFNDVVMMDFADLRLAAPVNYQHCLTIMEGPDYMRMPPLAERKCKHNVLYDCAVSYERYQKRFMQPEPGKKIAVAGTKAEIEKYISSVSRELRPSVIVSDEHAEQEFGQIQVCNWEEVLEKSFEYTFVICNQVQFKEIETKFRNAGIEDYYIWISDTALLFS